MKALLVLLVFFGTILSAQESEADYLGESYNARFTYIDECVYLFVETEHGQGTGRSLGYGHCDHYTDDSMDLFERSYTLSGGLSAYSVHLFRDGLYLGALVGLEYAEVDAVFSSSSGRRFAIKPMLVLGYQWHFKRGFHLAFGGGAQLRIPVWFEEKIDQSGSQVTNAKLHNSLIVPGYDFKPTLFVGWRF